MSRPARALARLASEATRGDVRRPLVAPFAFASWTRLASSESHGGHAEASSDRVGAGLRGDGTAPRFYTKVEAVPIDDGSGDWGVALDGRTLKTPSRLPLAVPSRALATAVAAEWEWQITTMSTNQRAAQRKSSPPRTWTRACVSPKRAILGRPRRRGVSARTPARALRLARSAIDRGARASRISIAPPSPANPRSGTRVTPARR